MLSVLRMRGSHSPGKCPKSGNRPSLSFERRVTLEQSEHKMIDRQPHRTVFRAVQPARAQLHFRLFYVGREEIRLY
jgi:hypothetical protein